MSGQRTYWHLTGLGRRPTDYDIASSRLLYYPGRGFETEVPLAAWYRTHQVGSPLACGDWEQFRDPRETTYGSYVELQRDRETFVDGVLASLGERAVPAPWLALVERVLPTLRFPVHGLQMIAAYVGHMAPSGRIVIASLFQVADEVRRIQRFAYRMHQLGHQRPGFGAASRSAWQDDPVWQPLRELIERVLVAWDWGEALIALQLVVKPRFDELFGPQLAEVARAAGDDALAMMLGSLADDARWHRAWTRALIATAIADRPDNRDVIAAWVERWTPLAQRAIASFAPLVGGAAVEAAERAAREEAGA